MATQPQQQRQQMTAPAPEEEPGSAQGKGFDVRVRSGRTPYVDMGIWGPFHRKILKAIKYRTWQPVGYGKYIQKEVPGPSNFDQYTTIWKVFVVAALMSRHVSDFALDAYYKSLEMLVRLWPNS